MNNEKNVAYNIKNKKRILLIYKGDKKIFGVGLVIGIIIGANVAVILYACILVNKNRTTNIKRFDTRNI
mgnify:FL=1